MEAFTNLWSGRSGLAKAYWGWGVLGSLVWGVALAFVTPGSVPAILAALAFTCYFAIVNTGIWRAASQYQGRAIWSSLAKLAAAGGMVTVAVLAVALLFVAGEAVMQVGKPAPQRLTDPAPQAIDWEKGVMTHPQTNIGDRQPAQVAQPPAQQAPASDDEWRKKGSTLVGAPPSFESAERWTQESTNSVDIGPWLQYAPAGARFCRLADRTIVTVYPPGVKPQAEKANPFCATGSVSTPDQL